MTSKQPSTDRATVDDIFLAYRLILKRDPDPGGLAHYESRLTSGLTLDALIQELMASAERRRRVDSLDGTSAPPHNAGDAADRADLIRPQDVIAAYTVEQLNETADEYYQRIDDPLALMQKPFASLDETPTMLEDLGALLGGLHVGKSMRILDFGAGTCWLSRLLCQLNCEVISCDVSEAALAIGRRLFAEHPPLGRHMIDPQFVAFDGHRIPIDDASIDRIISFDAFHHVPNVEETLREFGRVLRPGGIVGFSEPGRFHSHDPQAQYEMRYFRVLENDIDVEALFALAQPAGFTRAAVRVLSDLIVPLSDYTRLTSSRGWDVERRVTENVRSVLADRSIFFLFKGDLQRDSRSHHGLGHRITLVGESTVETAGDTLELTFVLRNSGSATWLHINSQIHGVVRLGAHLLADDGRMLDVDYFRQPLPSTVQPGAEITVSVQVTVPNLPACTLVFDLVAEGVRWFENAGSQPVSVRVVRAGTA